MGWGQAPSEPAWSATLRSVPGGHRHTAAVTGPRRVGCNAAVGRGRRHRRSAGPNGRPSRRLTYRYHRGCAVRPCPGAERRSCGKGKVLSAGWSGVNISRRRVGITMSQADPPAARKAPIRTKPLPLEFPGAHHMNQEEIDAVTRVPRATAWSCTAAASCAAGRMATICMSSPPACATSTTSHSTRS